MTVLDRLKRLDDRVLGRPRPVTARTHVSSFLVGLVGTAAILGYATVEQDTSVLAGSGGFFGVLVASAVRWYRLRERSGDWDGRPAHRRNVLLALVLVPAVVVAWYAALFARGDREDRGVREQCELLLDVPLAGQGDGAVDDLVRACAEQG